MEHELVIKNGQCCIYQNDSIKISQTDIGVANGKIKTIGQNLNGAQIIDARNLHVLPGIVDSQVHFRDPGLTHKEDLETGTKSAALGGVTSIFEMPNTSPPTTTKEAFEEKIMLAQKKAWVNYAFFIGASNDNIDKLAGLETLPGCSGIKVFMGSSTGSLLVEDDEHLEQILKSGRRRVIIHAEDELRLKERKYIALDSQSITQHHIWRDEETALLATQRLLSLAEQAHRKVHVLHVTTAQEMALLKKHKAIASVEVTPQHLTLFAPDCYERLGSLAQMNPPIRGKEHQDALWKALQDGVVDIIGSDHAPHTLTEKSKTYPQSPSGMPGVQTLVPIMLNHVAQKNLSLEKFVELVCENPRKIFGCLSKGRIEVGLDADFTLVDLKKKNTIKNSWIASRCGWTPFDGMPVIGWPTHTVVGGRLIMQEDQLLTNAPAGTMVLFS